MAVLLTIDSVDPAGGSLRLRVLAIPGPQLPADGATLFTSLGAVPAIVVKPNQIDQERPAVDSFDSGDVADYPFDVYRNTIQMVAVKGTDTTLGNVSQRKVLPVHIEGASAAAGVSVAATATLKNGEFIEVHLTIRRTVAVRGWALALMAIYWAIAILAAGATYIVVRGRRAWESRHLAWFSALLFALVSLREPPRAPRRSAPSSTSMRSSSRSASSHYVWLSSWSCISRDPVSGWASERTRARRVITRRTFGLRDRAPGRLRR